MEVVPVGDTLRQLVLALGAALLVGNLAVILREWLRRRDPDRRRPNMKIVALNILIGAVLTVWGIGSLIAAAA